MEARARSAIADAATTFRAGATRLFQLPLERRPCPVVADLEVVEREPETFRYARSGFFFQVKGANYLRVVRLEGGQQRSKAAAERAHVGFRRISQVWHVGHELDALPRYGAATVLIDNRVAQNAVEPRDEALFISQRGDGPQGADEAVMDDVFCARFVVHTPAHEIDEVLPALQQRLEGSIADVGSRIHPESIPASGCPGIALSAGSMRRVTETAAARLPL